MKAKYWAKAIPLLTASLTLAACHPFARLPRGDGLPCPPAITKNQLFNRIVTSGDFPITITDSAKQKVGVHIDGDNENAAQAISINLTNHTLYLSSNDDLPHPAQVHVRVNANHLYSLTSNGRGKITMPHFHSRHFNLTQHGASNITIKGRRLGLNQVFSDGSGPIRISGIKSYNVNVKTSEDSTSAISLSGHIGLNELDAGGMGSINIKGITPKILYVKSNNDAPINLSGKINLVSLISTGTGDITINKIISNHLDVEDGGTGNLNLLGDNIGLKSLIYTGSGALNIFNVYSPGLCIRTSGKGGVINIGGQAKLNTLVATGHTDLNLLWLFSDKLKVWLDSFSHVRLAGTAVELDGMIRGDSLLDAKYLRAKTGYVSTFNHANASVWLQNRLFAKAHGQSNIYYYNKSPFIAKYSSLSGAVLPMQY